MRIRSSVSTLAAIAFAASALTLAPAQAGTAAPSGYRYKSCVGTEAACPYTGLTDINSTSVSLGGSAFCRTGSAALQKLGFVKLKDGKRSLVRTVRVKLGKSGGTRAVRISLTARLKAGKSLTGAVKFTTRARDCTAQNRKVQRFSMTYAGPL